jgi:hypothetical protein
MRGNATLIGRLEQVGRGREAAGRGGDCSGAGPGEAEEGVRRKEGEGEPLTGGAGTSARQEEKKKRQRPWAAAGEGVSGLLGHRVER